MKPLQHYIDQKEYTLNGIKIELFPFNQTFAQYTADIASDKRKYFEKPTTETLGDGSKQGTRMKWDRHELLMSPINGHYGDLCEKDLPEEGPKTQKDYQEIAEEYAKQLREEIESSIKREYSGWRTWNGASTFTEAVEVSYELGAGWEDWYLGKGERRQEVTDTWPGDNWLGGNFARLTLVDPELLKKVYEAEEVSQERARLEQIELKKRREAREAEEAKEAARAEAKQATQKVEELQRQLAAAKEVSAKLEAEIS